MRHGIFLTLIIITTQGIYGQEKKAPPCKISFEHNQETRRKASSYYERIRLLKNFHSAFRFHNESNHTLFAWPLRAHGNYDNIPNYYAFANYVDDDPTAFIKDYTCDDRSYNGHTGMDISLWPFWWHMMTNSYVQIAAAAPGIVVDVVDNNNNNFNCACEDANHNYISILHADSSISFYVHLKFNSGRVNPGDIVLPGQIIADVASSGCSSNPHLHFEIRDVDNNIIDPYVGPVPANDCNNFNEESWWLNQKPYREPQINRLMTHGVRPVIISYNGNNNFCSNGETINAKNHFGQGEKVYLGFGMFDWVNNTSVIYSVFAPDGSILYNNIKTNGTFNTIGAYYAVDSIILPANAQAGTYMFDANYQGVNYKHFFTVNCISSYNLPGTLNISRSYIASSIITSSAVITNNVKVMMQAGNSITLSPGFTATEGTTFKARIKDCNYSE